MNKKLVDSITIGSDPEMFLFSEEKNKFVPVCGLIGGTKEKPLPITDEGHAVQEDNVMVEYCIPPCKTKEEFIKNINFTKNYINDTLLKPLKLTSRCVASAIFEEGDLDSHQAKMFGCSESFNAYTLQINEVKSTNPLLRSSGGHLHLGYKDPDVETSLKLIKAMDLFLGVPSILLDEDIERRKLYGKAGEFRYKPYGLEYRVLSTFWTANDQLMDWAYESTLKAVEFVNNKGIITNESDIIHCINQGNKELAKEIIEDYRIVEILQGAY